MVEGQALHYYNSYPVQETQPQHWGFFHKTDPYLDVTNGQSQEIMMPGSPYSSQSDSEASLSSIESSSEATRPNKNKKTEMKCCWKACGMNFESLDQLASHVTKMHALSGVGGLFYCGWEGCSRNDRGFNARYKMLVHVRTHTNEKPHKCQLCDKSFSRAENLKIHSRSHSGEKPYACPIPGCSKAYSNSSDRFKHTRTHQVEKPYHCKVPGCSKQYTDPSSLRKHVKTYKHFSNENRIPDMNQTSNPPDLNELTNERFYYDKQIESDSFPYETVCEDTTNNDFYGCNMVCCKGESRHGEYFRLNALINLKAEEVQPLKWANVIDPYIGSKHNEAMEVDMPLDLSIHRK